MMEEPTCPATPPLSKCPATPPRAGCSKSTQSRWNDSPDHQEKPRTPTPNRPSSPENCAICLGALTNKSFTNSCIHQFCFVCLLEWSKVKAECPLCKVAFDSIIHNVRSQDDYDQYHIVRQTPPRPLSFSSAYVFWPDSSIGHHYRAFTEWMSNHGLTRRIMTHTLSARQASTHDALPQGPPTRAYGRGTTPNTTSAFRRSIYDRDLWARLQPDVTGRYRDCSPEFYQLNPAQVHRLVPFLNRELNVLLEGNGTRTVYVLEKILELLPRFSMSSTRFRSEIARLIGHQHAPHFCHELRAFASSPFDMVGYDRAVQYHPNGGAGYSIEIEDQDSSESGASSGNDDDVQIIETGSNPSASTSASASRSSHTSNPSLEQNTSVVTVYSDSDSEDTDVQVVGFVKPRHERTPEVVTLSSPEHPRLYSPRSPSPVDPSSPQSNDLICISLDNGSTAEHRWENTVNDSDASLDVTSSPQPLKPLKKTVRLMHHHASGSSHSSQPNSYNSVSSSDSEGERKRKHSKYKHSKRKEKKRSRKCSKARHSGSDSDNDYDESLPSTSKRRPSRKHKKSSPSSSKLAKRHLSPSSHSDLSDNNDSPPRTVLRSAIVSKQCSRRFSSSEEDEPHVPLKRERTGSSENCDSSEASDSISPEQRKSHTVNHERHRSLDQSSRCFSHHKRFLKHETSRRQSSKEKCSHTRLRLSTFHYDRCEREPSDRSRSVERKSCKSKRRGKHISSSDEDGNRSAKRNRTLEFSDDTN